jgi:hypothetical protein
MIRIYASAPRDIENEKHVASAKDQLKQLLKNSTIPFYSWKELIC